MSFFDFVLWIAGGIASISLALSVIHHKIVKPLRNVFKRWDRSIETLQGYDAIRDPEGNVVKPATPPLANRVTTIETTLERLASLLDRIILLEEKYAAHIAWSESWTTDAEKRLDALEQKAGI